MAFVKCRRRGEGGAVRILVFFLYISCEGIRVWSTQSASFCLHSCAVVRKCVQSVFWKVSGLLLLRDCMTGFKWAKVWRFFSSHFQTFLCACYVHVTVINLWHYHSCFSLCSFFWIDHWPQCTIVSFRVCLPGSACCFWQKALTSITLTILPKKKSSRGRFHGQYVVSENMFAKQIAIVLYYSPLFL